MQNLTVFFIFTPWRQSHKWEVGEDGLVDYNGSRISPREAYQRFQIDYPMFEINRAEVCERIDSPDGPRDYTWISLERFDRD